MSDMTRYISKNIPSVHAVQWNGTMESVLALQTLTNSDELCLFFSEGTLSVIDVQIPEKGTLSVSLGEYLVRTDGEFRRFSKELFEANWYDPTKRDFYG
jgi:hypothetical protein